MTRVKRQHTNQAQQWQTKEDWGRLWRQYCLCFIGVKEKITLWEKYMRIGKKHQGDRAQRWHAKRWIEDIGGGNICLIRGKYKVSLSYKINLRCLRDRREVRDGYRIWKQIRGILWKWRCLHLIRRKRKWQDFLC